MSNSNGFQLSVCPINDVNDPRIHCMVGSVDISKRHQDAAQSLISSDTSATWNAHLHQAILERFRYKGLPRLHSLRDDFRLISLYEHYMLETYVSEKDVPGRSELLLLQ